jgi:NAD-dependent dihydropyrimidine dehydrogenase PreA subunit
MAAGKYMNIPREEIPWFPAIDEDLCTNCGSCIEFCANGVFALDDVQTRVVAPYNCVVGCSACASECESQAIRFPEKQELVKALRELRAHYQPQAG